MCPMCPMESFLNQIGLHGTIRQASGMRYQHSSHRPDPRVEGSQTAILIIVATSGCSAAAPPSGFQRWRRLQAESQAKATSQAAPRMRLPHGSTRGWRGTLRAANAVLDRGALRLRPRCPTGGAAGVWTGNRWTTSASAGTIHQWTRRRSTCPPTLSRPSSGLRVGGASRRQKLSETRSAPRSAVSDRTRGAASSPAVRQ